MADTQNPVYADNVSITGDGTEEHPLASTGNVVAPPGSMISISGGDTNNMGLVLDGTVEPNAATLTNQETGGTVEITADGNVIIGSSSGATSNT